MRASIPRHRQLEAEDNAEGLRSQRGAETKHGSEDPPLQRPHQGVHTKRFTPSATTGAAGE